MVGHTGPVHPYLAQHLDELLAVAELPAGDYSDMARFERRELQPRGRSGRPTAAITNGSERYESRPRWLVFFAAWRSAVLLIMSGSMVLCRRGFVAGMSRDVGVDAEAA